MLTAAVSAAVARLLPNSPSAQRLADAMLADERRVLREARTNRVAKYRQLDASLLASHKAREEPRSQELAEIERRAAALEAARNTHLEREAAWRGAANAIECQRDRVEAQLTLAAEPTIKGLLAEAFQQRWHTGAIKRDVIVVDWDWEGRPKATWTNGHSIDARAEAITVLIHDISTWHLEDLDDEALQARFAARLEALPAIEERPAREGWR